MLWYWLFLLLRGDEFLLFLFALILAMKGEPADPRVEPVDSTFIKEVDFMFPENFLSRYPQEANPYRLKILTYLIFNLLVKGYGSVDPSSFWLNYNRDDIYRAAIDAVFYEYLTNFTDREVKGLLFNPLDGIGNNISKPVSNEEIAIDRIGQYLDLLSANGSRIEAIQGAYDILSELNESPVMSKSRMAECGVHIPLVQISGIAGKDYPNFCDIPKTSFTCVGKRIPGIYADYETGCQAFHVCWPLRRDSFLCPIGTIFNQSLLTCDIWHDTACFSSPLFHRDQFKIDGVPIELDIPKYDGSCESLLNKPLRSGVKFLPAKCEVKDFYGQKLDSHCDGVKSVTKLDMINMMDELMKILKDLRNELKNMYILNEIIGSPRIHVFAKHLDSIQNLGNETVEAIEFTRKLGETSRPPKAAEQINLGNFPPVRKAGLSVTSSTLLKPSKSLEEHTRNSKQDVPEIVMRSLRLGGTILNEGIIPLAKQVIIDSYRKIESKNR